MGTCTSMALHSLVDPLLESKVHKQAGFSNTVDSRTKLLITLRLLAGGKYLDLSWPYGDADSTVYSIFDETLTAIEMSLRGNISFPKTERDCRKEARKFQHLRRSPIHGIISALDGVAIAIQSPTLEEVPNPRKYLNRKRFYAICVQAVFGADYRFQFLSACHAGSCHDATAYRASKLYGRLTNEDSPLPKWATVVADDAYPNSQRLITPYPGQNLSPAQDSLNYYIFQSRNTDEQVFGMLKNKFGIFNCPLSCRVGKSTLIIMVCGFTILLSTTEEVPMNTTFPIT